MKLRKLLWVVILLGLVATGLAQEAAIAPAAITPNDALILENIPAIPARIATRADRYTQFRSASMWSWHPQRREILIGTRFGDTNQVHQVAMPGGARTQLTFFPDRIADASYHPHSADYFLFRTRFGDTNQVHQVAMPGGARTQLTFFPDRIADASYHPHSADYFLFRKDIGGGEWYQIFRFDVVTGDTTLLTDGKSRNTE